MTMVETPRDMLSKVEDLVPELHERAASTAAGRRVPKENIEALRAAGALKTLQARRNGGLGLGIRAHLDVISTLGRGCGSTAWVAGVVQTHSWLISHMTEQAQNEIYGDFPDAVVAAVIGPRGTAVKTPDGYRLTGVWPFGSGCQNSEWLLLGAMVADEQGNIIDSGDFAVPRDEVTIKDDWYVSGLAGTGSCTMTVTDIEIPEHRFVSLPGIIAGDSPGASLHTSGEWTHQCAAVPVLTIALCGGAIGIAKQALADYPAAVRGKVIAYTADDQATHAFTHIRLGEAAARIREGELLLYGVADELDATAAAGGTVALLRRAEMRNDCAVAVRRLLEGVEILSARPGRRGPACTAR